ncbi:thioredoxin-like protein Dim1 isoform X2 [Rhipicephalus microplus]|uniref:thioredoxin-like protein Dim1 isoform X2 n=1 Tax=Rhipicephalus microplus TaxID=6941 RepID=UPI003F6B6BE0
MWASEQPGRLRLRWTNVQRATTCRRCRHGSSSTMDCISLPAHASTHLPWSATWRLRCPGLYMRSSGNPLSLGTVAPSTCGSQIARSSTFFSSSSACCTAQAMWASEQPGRLRLRWTNVQRATTCRRCRHGSSSTIDGISLPAHASTHLPWSATWRLRCPGLYMRSSGNPLSLGTVAPSTCGSQIARLSTFFRVSSHVVHAAAPAQWLASRPGHPVGGGPGGGHPLWPRLGPHLHEDGRGALLHCREDTAQVYIAQFQQINIVVKNFAALYLVDISEVPDFNKMYELYDPCTVMFFFRNKHIMIDLGTGNNNKINWALEDKQEMIDIIETVYRGARKGRGLVVSPKDYSTKYRY